MGHLKEINIDGLSKLSIRCCLFLPFLKLFLLFFFLNFGFSLFFFGLEPESQLRHPLFLCVKFSAYHFHTRIESVRGSFMTFAAHAGANITNHTMQKHVLASCFQMIL